MYVQLKRMGLMEFIRLKFPDRPDLLVIKPAVDGSMKGFFPAGKICEVFGREFKRWNESFKRCKKRQEVLDEIIACMNRERDEAARGLEC
jgi:hypothetical protein